VFSFLKNLAWLNWMAEEERLLVGQLFTLETSLPCSSSPPPFLTLARACLSSATVRFLALSCI
jgi:hypothetical protein